MEKTFGRNHETSIHFTQCSTQTKHRDTYASNQRSLEKTRRGRYQQSTMIQQTICISFAFQRILQKKSDRHNSLLLNSYETFLSTINHKLWNKILSRRQYRHKIENHLNRKTNSLRTEPRYKPQINYFSKRCLFAENSRFHMAVTLNPLADRTLRHISALEVTKKHENMKTECPSETLTSIYQFTRRHVPEEITPQPPTIKMRRHERTIK
jgi:hypothetical protein